ncbi:MAG TPA: 3-isopropylmalate dehydratase small subunit [Candidatus Caldiarchaeum subterraneum]|uniref:3-isopropylmalate dehydratase n=1 Tax=Caldiarchaeum subterraneum TaxID=311458 RepID=A0A833E9H7_CALS0|nr:3-isopropylmalate dehydratase small subunit [Aigarchaeota archaeon]HIQ29159.1 3-isopropylmalate dehydratase small subunit [Candidatus Caldarchaeum subterraneum]
MPEQIKVIEGKAAPLEADDVDTDQIIPAQFLKLLEKKGLGKYLFYRWRYDEQGSLKGDFILDRPEYRDAKILIAGRNFGIGSSRENAVWALTDFGIKCVIASSFGDIFYTNASKNGLVCIKLPDEQVNQLRKKAREDLTLTIDLENQVIKHPGGEIKFEMEPHIKERLTKGLDDIAITLSQYEEKIREYEGRMPSYLIPKARRFLNE